MKVIYHPKGRAFEYAPLALNLYTGCVHGCKYCYAPGSMHRKRHRDSVNEPLGFHDAVEERPGLLSKLAADAAVLEQAGCQDEILMSFSCDPYPPGWTTMTRSALVIIGEHRLRATVLTKGGLRAVPDFDLLSEYGFRFGTSLSWWSDRLRAEWEPGAASVYDRFQAIEHAHAMGIPTWVSVEPVINPVEALAVIENCKHVVDAWKIGKWNHDARANAIDWAAFLRNARALLDSIGKPYIIKHDLLEAAANG